MSLGTAGATARYLFGFGNSAGSQRLILMNSGANWLNLQWSIVSTATDLPPLNQFPRIAGNIYQGRRCKDNERGLFGIIYDGTYWYCVWNGVRVAQAAAYSYVTRTASAITHDGYLYVNGAAYSALNSYNSNPIFREYALIDHAASDVEIAQYWRYIAAPTETSVYCFGDSITFGSQATTDATLGTANGYPQKLQELGASRVVTNWGKVADKTSQILFRVDSSLKYFLPRNRGAKCVAVVLAGANDLIATTDSGAVIYSRIVQVCSSLRRYGCGTIIVCTVTASTSITGGRETARQELNALILSRSGVDFSVASNIAARTNLSNPNNATYYADGLHPTDAGYVEIATGIDASLAALSL
jgi:lysophospholipase L1-like esterase